MNERIFKDIQELLPVYDAYRTTGFARISVEQKFILKELAKTLLRIPQPNIACESCVSSYLGYIQSFYEREYPKFLKEKQDSEAAIKQQKQPKTKPENSSNQQAI